MTQAERRAIIWITLVAGLVVASSLYLMSDYSPLNHDSRSVVSDDQLSALLEQLGSSEASVEGHL